MKLGAWPTTSAWPSRPDQRDRAQGLSTTLMASSCFFWKIS